MSDSSLPCSPAHKPTRLRSWIPFPLRVLLGLNLLFGVILAAAAYRWHAVRSQERQATSDMHPYGGVYSMASARYIQRTGQSKGWLFNTFLNHVDAVDLSPHNWAAMERSGKTHPVDDDALGILNNFSSLRSLDVRDTQITDDGLRHIIALKQLEQLDIRGTGITDEGFQKLRVALPNCGIDR